MTTRPKRPPGRPRTFDRERTVALALEEYWRCGLHQLSLNAVCRLAGISKPTLYREFGGEDELMAAALELYRRERVLPLLARLAEERPLSETIEDAVVGLTTDDGTPAGCLFTRMRISTSALGPQTSKRVRALEAEQQAAIYDWFRRGLERGDADPDLDPALAARYVDTQIACILTQMGEGVPSEQVRKQARLALSVLAGGSKRTKRRPSPRMQRGRRTS